MNKKWTLLSGLIASVVMAGAAGVAQAADWKPTKPIELIAPAGPGGGWDLLARSMQKALTEEKLVDQPVLVTNKPGGGGASGWNYLKSKSGQGEFLAMTSALVLQNNLLGKSDLTYKDFFPLANLMTEWEVVAVKADAPWKDGKEFFEALKKDPANMHIGVGPALGNNDHIQFLALAKRYGADPADDVRFRVIADHVRSGLMLMTDGVTPGNEARGYVLRRLLRRAARHGKLLGVNDPFLYEVCDTVIHENEGHYPELRERQDYITKVIRTEEENFAKTIDGGMKIFTELLNAHKEKGETVFSGADAFKLYDTYGFPIDLTLEMAQEQGLGVDEATFRNLMAFICDNMNNLTTTSMIPWDAT